MGASVMDYLLGLLSQVTDNEALTRLLVVGAIGMSTVIAVVTVTLLVLGLQSPLQRRLALIKRGHASVGVGREAPGNLQLLLERVGRRLGPTAEGEVSTTRTLLTHAGYGSTSAVRAAFPDALDLMVVCVESGLALPQAIERVAEEMAVSQAELAEELALVNAQIRAGISSTEALRQLADRTGLEDIQGLVSLLAQSIRFGTSVAATLRIYAEEFRDRRMQAAEEMGAKIGTKLVFPLIFCLWPSFFLVAIGPVIIGILKTFGSP